MVWGFGVCGLGLGSSGVRLLDPNFGYRVEASNEETFMGSGSTTVGPKYSNMMP